MLKNVAIPLMLAATEAEGQKFTEREVKEAMKTDRDADVPAWRAPEAACTVASNTDISTKAGAVSDAQQAYDNAVQAVADAEAEGGAWGVADKARREAVAAAEEAENETNVAGLLDALDEKAGLERAAAAAYAVAANADNAGVLAKEIATQANSDTESMAGTLGQEKDDAVSSQTNANEQHAKETLWREWLYCELGAVVAGDPNQLDASWWKNIASSAGEANQPAYCTVPAVKMTAESHAADYQACADASPGYDDDTNGNYATLKNTFEGCITQRPAVRYYNAVCTSACAGGGADLEGSASDTYAQFLTKQLDVAATATVEGYRQRWTATLAHTVAVSQKDATTSPAVMGGIARNQQGIVNWRIGDLKAKQWIEQQRIREKEFYEGMQASRLAAAAVASSMSTGDTYTVTNPAPTGYTHGLTADADGAKKLQLAALSARDAAGAGAKTMPQKRTTDTGVWLADNTTSWLTSWAALDNTQMKAWNDANGTPGAVSTWWAAAWQLSRAQQAWDEAQRDGTGITGTKSWSQAVTDAVLSYAETNVQAAGDTDNGVCDLADTVDGGKWTSHASDPPTEGANSEAACQTVCTDINGDANGKGIFYDAGSDRGGNVYAKFSTANPTLAYYCGGYSFDSTALDAAKCKVLIGAHDGVINTGDVGVTASKCAKLTPSATLIEFQNLQKAVSTKYDAVKEGATIVTDMVAAIATQVELEKAWLEAWYVQQYWAAITAELAIDADGSMAKTVQGFVTVLSGGSGDGRASKAGAESDANDADTALTTAQSTLASLAADVTSAQATVAELSSRILSAGVEMAELRTLAAENGTDGKLDAQVAKRTAVYDAYVNDGTSGDKGPRQLAIDALAAATEAVKERSGAETDGVADADGGALLEAKITKQAEWDQAKQDAETAESNLTAAIPLANGDAGTLEANALTELRQAVVSASSTWDDENTALTNLIGTVGSTLATLVEAKEAQDDAVLACQIAAYDDYRTEFETEMLERAAALADIKKLLDAYEEPAPGKEGARCEKALSNGTWRPARGEQTCEEGLCCGAARVWMPAGVGAETAAWMTIETCQLNTASVYAYAPARAPMSTTWPGTTDYPFACIEGAHKLAAAASAVAAAVYMLA